MLLEEGVCYDQRVFFMLNDLEAFEPGLAGITAEDFWMTKMAWMTNISFPSLFPGRCSN